jgi:predicted AlkP superfamily phosphohydrolase/phosphomutase
MDDDTTLFIISDHGGGPAPTKYVNLNVALEKAGLFRARNTTVRTASNRLLKKTVQSMKTALSQHEVMRLKRWIPDRMQRLLYSVSQNTNTIDWESTRAYRFSMTAPAEGVMVNLIGRQPKGVVPKADYESVRKAVIEVLRGLTEPQTGARIVKEVHFREEVFWGEHVQDAPDIIVVLEDGYRGGSGTDALVSAVPADTLNFWSGDHRMEGIFMAYGNNIRPGVLLPPLSLEDFAPTALYAAGLRAMPAMRGSVATGAFVSPYQPSLSLPVLPHAGEPRALVGQGEGRSTDPLSLQEEQALVERLRGLGYIE